MNEATRELIRYRLGEARETLSDAEDLLRKGSVRSAANRTYYAVFYAALAVLATRDLSSSKHTGVIGLFHREFVKTGIFPKELAEVLDRAFDLRGSSDYREFVVPDKEAVAILLDNAKAFVSKAEGIAEGEEIRNEK